MAATPSAPTTLQDTLAAVREVGNAAIAAFRIETAMPTKPDGPRGWRWVITQLFSAETSF